MASKRAKRPNHISASRAYRVIADPSGTFAPGARFEAMGLRYSAVPGGLPEGLRLSYCHHARGERELVFYAGKLYVVPDDDAGVPGVDGPELEEWDV